MKIAQIACTYPPYKGGIGNAALIFASVLEAAGYDISTYTAKTSDPDSQDSDNKVKRLKPLLKMGNAAFLPGLFKEAPKYDLLILHYPFYGSAEAVWLIRKFAPKTKLLLHYHMDVEGLGFPAGLFQKFAGLFRTPLLDSADKITCASLDYIKSGSIRGYFEAHPDKFDELPFAKDLSFYHPGMNEGERPANTILFIGGLDRAHYFKGLGILLEAFADFHKKDLAASWKLKIIGGGDLMEGYREQAKSLGIGSSADFLGPLGEELKIQELRQADFLVLPSINRNEAFGIVLIEALACGLPVIATGLPGVRSVFENGRQGLLAKAGDPSDLSEKIQTLAGDADLRARMGREALALAREKYSLATFQKKIIKIIQTI